MKRLFFLCTFGLAMTTSPLYASPGQKLAEKNGCMGCHLLDRKTVGPAIRQIAHKYAHQKGAEAKLFEKVKHGGGGGYRHGNWGDVPMPPNPQVSDEDLKKILAWMLKQK
ncbi:MAG: c-type cytochrome [Thiobacillaceae bacterium]|jgi:cytochrome c